MMMKMNRKGFTLVEIMIVVAIVALLAAIAIPGLLRARVNANESAAQSTLKTIATGCESYASSYSGNYPAAVTDMTNATPPFLTSQFSVMTDTSTAYSANGYDFVCGTMASSGYSCTATPTGCITGTTTSGTGTKTYTISTGAVLETENCTAPAS